MFGKFKDAFCPWRAYENKSVLADSPCKDCEVSEWMRVHEMQIKMSDGFGDEVIDKCSHCLKHTLWLRICLSKLKWYEENDPRLKVPKICNSYRSQNGRYVCYGTKDMEPCSCGGSKRLCDFYPEYRSS